MVVSASKTLQLVPALVVCLLAVAAVGCLVHTDSLDAAQTAHQGHRHPSSSSSAHITLDLHCLVAILSGVVVLVWLYPGVLYLPVLLSNPIVQFYRPFIPPKAIAHG